MKKILVMNFFPAFVPPQSGGELRYYNIYSNLSRFFDVTLLSPTYKDHKLEVIKHSDTFREYRVPKEEVHDRLHWRLDDECICEEMSALVCSLSAKTFNKYHELYQEIYPTVDIIIHEFPYMLDYDSFFGLDSKLRIYNSHNFEYNLVKQMWKGPNAEQYLERIYKAEEKLVQNCDIVFATSEEERQKFISVFSGDPEKIKLAPNGIDVALYEDLRKNNKKDDTRKKAFFIGSGHPPNVEAMQFVLEEVAPQCSQIDFYIAGKCCESLQSSLNNVFLLGLVDEQTKNKLFAEADIAINPMFSGAGTNLKTLEYMSAGIPVISTEVGVRGLGVDEGIHYVKAEKEEFADVLQKVILNRDRLDNIAQNGKKFVNEHFSWEGICNNIAREIQAIHWQRKKVQRLLVLNDYGIDKPISGGEVRCYNILKELSKNFEVVFVCLNNQQEVVNKELLPNFYYFSLPKTKKHLEEEEMVNSKYWISANDIVTSYMISENEYAKRFVKNLSESVDGIILEHPYMAFLLKEINDKFIVYESHNFEYSLKKRMLKGHPLFADLVEKTKQTELEALQKCDLLVTVSEKENIEMQNFCPKENRKTITIKNGVTLPHREYNYDIIRQYLGKPIAIFVGSSHMPNVEAAKYITLGIAPKIPEIYFAFVGNVCDAIKDSIISDNVLLFGKLSEEEKNFILYSSDIALNPMAEGAGSNLKLAEYFAFEIPVITTPIGARGYKVENRKEALICSLEQFPNEIKNILRNKYDVDTITKKALEYVKKELSWEVLGNEYSECLEKMLSRKKLLVCTYRYNFPPRGGAEVYVTNVLKRIASRNEFDIDIVTTDVGDINQKFRFACDFSKDLETQSGCAGIRVIKFPVETPSVSKQWKACREIYDTFMDESHIIARKFTNLYTKPLLLGGWHYPEKTDQGMQIWSSGMAEIFVKDVQSICLQGYSPKKLEITIIGDGVGLNKCCVDRNFRLEIPVENVNVVTLKMNTFSVENQDPRPLGVLIQEIITSQGILMLTEDYKSFLRQNFSENLIQEYIHLAKARDKKIETLFYDVRGPHSEQMLEWMEKHIEKYDIVLGHSVPFDTIYDATRISREHHKPVVTLPHFHMEDDFYHWNLYYESMYDANTTLCFPNAAKSLFFDKIQAEVDLVPGGGVDTAEFVNAGEWKYGDKPFVLVLGRKAGSKNYKWTIDAIEELNKQGEDIRLLIVGKDEDEEPINVKGVEYLGEQPRDIVIAALKNCSFVVNMSGSESFGIVILEAWMAEKPIIVNEECKAFAELVEDHKDGLHANRSNLKEKIKELYHDDTLRKNMGRVGKKKVEGKYTWDSIAENIEAILLREIYAPKDKVERIQGAYDFVFSLGASCQVAENLRRRDLRKIAGPFDWFTFPSVNQLTGILQNDFQEFMQLKNLKSEGEHDAHMLVRDIETGCLSVHDFVPSENLEKQYPAFEEQLNRRIARMKDALDNCNNKILLIRTQYDSQEEIQKLRQCLTEKYKASIDLLCINYIEENEVHVNRIGEDFIIAEIPFREEMGWKGCRWAWDVILEGISLR